jgi:hypothetical protein
MDYGSLIKGFEWIALMESMEHEVFCIFTLFTTMLFIKPLYYLFLSYYLLCEPTQVRANYGGGTALLRPCYGLGTDLP